MVDRLGDESELAGIDVEMLRDLGPKALRVDDDRLGGLHGPRVVDPAVHASRGRDRTRLRERMHRLDVQDERPRRVRDRCHQRVEHVDAGERKPKW